MKIYALVLVLLASVATALEAGAMGLARSVEVGFGNGLGSVDLCHLTSTGDPISCVYQDPNNLFRGGM
jgi:hypothetical protein